MTDRNPYEKKREKSKKQVIKVTDTYIIVLFKLIVRNGLEKFKKKEETFSHTVKFYTTTYSISIDCTILLLLESKVTEVYKSSNSNVKNRTRKSC